MNVAFFGSVSISCDDSAVNVEMPISIFSDDGAMLTVEDDASGTTAVASPEVAHAFNALLEAFFRALESR